MKKDNRKFISLYEKHSKSMYTVAFDILKDRYAAEDAVQEAFIKVMKNLDKVEDVNSHKAKRYLIAIVRSTAIDMYRSIAKQNNAESILEYNATWEKEAEFNESHQENLILKVINGMPSIYKDILILKYVDQYENDEIAKMLGISNASVRKRISRGKKIIEQRLDSREV